ncbi:hypothetical protein BX285_3292 [Streptomyces sp. 1114.5]|nr:hypothetical protein BX285_3292 [Streptomyces sp. 1114.5]SOB85058.1 hypothetical protein SAMN06272789_5322 [Streptomyces sp. 1331.2]
MTPGAAARPLFHLISPLRPLRPRVTLATSDPPKVEGS